MIPPPLTAIALLVCAHVFILISPQLRIGFYQSSLLGAVLIFIGAGITLWSFVLFRIIKTTLNPNKKPQKLIVKGPYKFSRNPMYLGIVIVLLGYAILQGSIIFLIVPVIFFLLMDNIVIPFEEKLVKETGDNKSNEYFKRVRRWL